MTRLAEWLLDPAGLTPHGFCLLWQPGLIWLHAVSDICIALAYFTIPAALAFFAQRRSDVVYRPVLWLFAAFILLCGTGHLLDLATLWLPAYWLEGSVKALTAVISILTAVALWRLMPHALAMPSLAQLRQADLALRESEDQLRQAQKMEAIGHLTGGVAHDFNNVLAAVIGSLDLIRSRVRDTRPDVAGLAQDAINSAGRAAGLISQLLTFARRQRLEPKALDVAHVAHGLEPLLQRSLGPRVTLAIHADDAPAVCFADQNQLESALLNLVINARDAIGGTGTVTITVQVEQIAHSNEAGSLAAGDYIRVAVRDDGPGMAEEVRRRAFEPFFTTKPPGQGSGLGLAQIHGFAHQSGGTVAIASAPGEGCEVAILLPRAAVHSPPPASRQPVQASLGGAGERVLVVDDDPVVRGTIASLLREIGFDVVEASNAAQALTRLEDPRIEAVVTDLTMPGHMDGLDLADHVRQQRPGLAVVLMTGHLDPFHDKRLTRGVEFLQKPCDTAALVAALRRALAAHEATV